MDNTTKTITIYKKLLLRVDLVFYLFSFLIPFILSGPQLLTGSVVNAILYSASIKLDKKSLLLVIILPSLGAFSHGVVFGPLTFYLFYFLPFIWIGNAFLVYIFRQKKIISLGLIRILLASGVKASFLYLVARMYFAFHIVPRVFVTSMGTLQLVTAMAGGVLALGLFKLKLLKSSERDI